MITRPELYKLVYKLIIGIDALDAFNRLMALNISSMRIFYKGNDEIIIIKKEGSITIVWDVIYEEINCRVFWLDNGTLMSKKYYPFELIEHLIMTSPTIKNIPTYDYDLNFTTTEYGEHSKDLKSVGNIS